MSYDHEMHQNRQIMPSGCKDGLSSDEAAAWLNDHLSEPDSAANSDFIWLHFNLRSSVTEKWLTQHLSLPDHYFETLQETTGATRIEREDDCLIVVINDVSYDFSFDASQFATLWMCVGHRFVISARHQPLRSVDELRVSVKSGESFDSPIFLLAHLLRDQADVLQKIGRNASNRVGRIEDELLKGNVEGKRDELGSLRRVFVRLQRLLAPEPGALFRLLNRLPNWLSEADSQELRSATEESSAVLGDIAALQERIRLLQEDIAAKITEQTNRSLFVLTMVTVLALPINIVAGLFGMNVAGIPLSQEPYGFEIIVGIIAIFTVVAVKLAFFRHNKPQTAVDGTN